MYDSKMLNKARYKREEATPRERDGEDGEGTNDGEESTETNQQTERLSKNTHRREVDQYAKYNKRKRRPARLFIEGDERNTCGLPPPPWLFLLGNQRERRIHRGDRTEVVLGVGVG